MTARRRPHPAQLALAAHRPDHGRGGYRHRAGRKRKPEDERRGHGLRPELAARFPVHVTLKVRPDVANLRRGHLFAALRACFAEGKDRFGFRLTDFTVQGHHLHLICEAEHKTALSRGLQGLEIRIARRLNRKLGRTGALFAERYHERILRTPTEIRRALVYVYQNSRKHTGAMDRDWVDPCTSAPWFTGWRWPIRDMRLQREGTPPVVRPRTWLLAEGWKRAGGLITFGEAPAAVSRRTTAAPQED